MTSVQRIAAGATALLLAAACASTPPAQEVSVAPIPYTVEQLRATCKPGHTIVFRLEAPGQPAVTRTIRFLSATPEAAEIESSAVDDQGRIVEPLRKGTSRWEELRHHAAFPSERTQISAATITTPAGTFDSTLYTVRGDGGEATKFYFARNLAGPPVLMVTEKDGAAVRTMTLTSVKD